MMEEFIIKIKLVVYVVGKFLFNCFFVYLRREIFEYVKNLKLCGWLNLVIFKFELL